MWISLLPLFAAVMQSMRTGFIKTRLAREKPVFTCHPSSLLCSVCPWWSVYLVAVLAIFGWVSVEKSLIFWAAHYFALPRKVMANYFIVRASSLVVLAFGDLAV